MQSWATEFRCINPLIVNYELQLNRFAISAIDKHVSQMGFESWVTFPTNKYLVFGTSRPDFTFGKMKQSDTQTGTILSEEPVAATTEFKVHPTESFRLLPI